MNFPIARCIRIIIAGGLFRAQTYCYYYFLFKPLVVFYVDRVRIYRAYIRTIYSVSNRVYITYFSSVFLKHFSRTIVKKILIFHFSE